MSAVINNPRWTVRHSEDWFCACGFRARFTAGEAGGYVVECGKSVYATSDEAAARGYTARMIAKHENEHHAAETAALVQAVRS